MCKINYEKHLQQHIFYNGIRMKLGPKVLGSATLNTLPECRHKFDARRDDNNINVTGTEQSCVLILIQGTEKLTHQIQRVRKYRLKDSLICFRALAIIKIGLKTKIQPCKTKPLT